MIGFASVGDAYAFAFVLQDLMGLPMKISSLLSCLQLLQHIH